MQAAEMITAPKIAILAALIAASPIVAECGEWNTSRDVIAAKATGSGANVVGNGCGAIPVT